MNHLHNIELRQRQSRMRDFFFAAVVALATVISLSSISTAAYAAAPATHLVAR